MEQKADTSGKSKWFGQLGWLFITLFAVFWSLGSFFFWFLLGLSAMFGSLSMIYSGIHISLFDNLPTNKSPYQSYTSAMGRPPVAGNELNLKKALRIFFIIGVTIFMLVFVVEIFAPDNEATTESIEVEPVQSESIEEPTFASRGITLFNDGQYDSALMYYNKALEVTPNDADLVYNKALAYYLKEDYRTAIRIARSCLRLSPDYREAWWLQGGSYFELNQYDSAIFSLETAYSKNLREQNFLILLGNVYLKKGNRSKAKDLYLEVVKIDTTQAEVYRQLAELDPEHAESYRAKAKAIDSPEDNK
ncbi:hypothetical protein BH10BAC4_BH10BAC4_01060 [soil metagenome]